MAIDTQSTSCPEELALAAMAYEFFSWADRRERRRDAKSSRWGPDVAAAWDRLQRAKRAWGAEPRLTTRREYSGQASA